MAQRFSSNGGPSQRQLRAGELIRHILSEIFQRGEVHDDAMPTAPLTVSEVKASPDLRNATVYVSVLGQDDISETVKRLNKVSGKIRTALARKMTLKFTPQLAFRADDRFDEAARIDALIRGTGDVTGD